MASPVTAEEHSNTKSEEGTTAFHKKRSRRVSFAENTSVHIFDRDEETPPDPNAPSSPYEDLGFSDRDAKLKQFFGNEEDDNEDDDTDELGPRSPFFRVVRSPSSGGSTIGSATSNDEDNFFGLVSAKFIKRDLSDSVTSNGNHDQTMDSTSFSMHFNSIARSDSEADLKTSTGVDHLSFEEKTPTSSMLLTLNKKPNFQPDVSTSKFSIDSQSNDMSLVGEYHNKYDYGKLSISPASDAHNDLHVVSHISVLKSPLKDGKQFLANKENKSDIMDFSYVEDKTKKAVKDSFGINSSMESLVETQSSPNFKNMVFQADDIMEMENKSPLTGSITHFIDMQDHMLLNDDSLYKSPGTLTPFNQPSFLLTQKHGGSVSSLEKSISKLRILEAFPFSAALNAKLENSNSKSLLGISKMNPFITLNKNNKSPQPNFNNIIGSKTVDTCSVLQNDSIAPVPVKNVESRKRKTEDMMTEKIARIKWSSRFLTETKLLSHSVDKMNLHAIDCLFDILEKLQMSKTYELLSNEIKSHIQHKRKMETRLLLCKILHEKAKLQLMHVKREKLLKNKQSLAFGIQESEALKLKYSPQNLLNAQVIHHQEGQIDNEKVTTLSVAIKDTDKRIQDLIQAFHISFKMKQEVNPTDAVAFVNNHLMKKTQCQIIRKDLQLWVIEDLKSSKDHHYLVLNYLDLMTQRFIVISGVVTSISVSYILNETNIVKSFNDMDALIAFRFVFNVGLSTQKHIDHTSLAYETQMNSSVLGNLVDVMEEIQLARIELKNLIHARFHVSLDKHLHLELYFFNSIIRKKATVTLNTSCLKRGIYPSEILSCQIETQSQNSSSSSLSDEITAEIKDLKVGFLRILQLCKCISQVINHSR
ncbi:unnamed protein product [Lactuca virosa]|uniref:Uncharacterized protein n=1 Tax=Lactuca virosa TaxID=75947 RepID=A0AAU9MLZ6_9ASTR|nr:unnamed protein product [Lactuca virosa]